MTNVDAVIFDLDGTLTSLEVDFAELRHNLGFETGPVWESILAMPEDERRRAEHILMETELAGAHACTVLPGARELLAELARRNMPSGILTRNCRQAAEIALARHGLKCQAIFAREDGPMKPDPAGVIALARQFRVQPSETILVGDYVFDIEAGNNAGATTVLYCVTEKAKQYQSVADYVISDLSELTIIIDSHNQHVA